MNKNIILFINLLIIKLFFLSSVDAQNAISPLFESHSILNLKIKANYNKLLEDVGEDTKDHPAKIKYNDEEGETRKIKIEIETRGNFRSNPSNCDFPPLKLEFEEFSETTHTLFKGQKELKLVTHCQKDIPSYQRHVYREYMIYRFYNVLTPVSFNVRLCKLNYKPRWWINSNIKPAFLIEDNKMLAKRLDGIELDNDDDYYPVDTTQLATLALFEYMIGNTDWSVDPMQNLEIIRVDSMKHLPVPYDFDLSSIVNPPYGAEAMHLDSAAFLKRRYRGPAFDKKTVQNVYDLFNEKKQELLHLANDNVLLNENEKERISDFLQKFFKEINSRHDEAPWIE